jgi:hypothetical protein
VKGNLKGKRKRVDGSFAHRKCLYKRGYHERQKPARSGVSRVTRLNAALILNPCVASITRIILDNLLDLNVIYPCSWPY